MVTIHSAIISSTYYAFFLSVESGKFSHRFISPKLTKSTFPIFTLGYTIKSSSKLNIFSTL